MTPGPGEDQGRIDDILDLLRDIREHLKVGWEVFSRDRDLQKVVAYDLVIMGEAVTKVSKQTQKRNPRIPWTALAEYRNALIHEDTGLSLADTWEFVQKELRGVERKLSRVRVCRDEV